MSQLLASLSLLPASATKEAAASATTPLTLLFLLCARLSLTPAVEYQGIDDSTNDYGIAEENDEIDKELGVVPEFESPSATLTAVAGQVVVLSCAIEKLGKYKVAWLDSSSVPLTFEDRRVIDDSRYSIVRPQIKHWNLQIRDIRKDDEGQYMCSINTFPVKSRNVTLYVKVPPQISAELSSGDTTVKEGSNFTLTCRVSGVPPPQIMWHRKSFFTEKESDGRHCEPGTPSLGEVIAVYNISRFCGGIYECNASNGVSSSVSRQIRVTVEYAPKVRLQNSRISQLIGRETILECEIDAFPHHENFWEKDKRKVSSSDRHRVDVYEREDSHRLTLSLRIFITSASDYGDYKCIASNSIGTHEGTMQLVEQKQKPLVSESTSKATHEVNPMTIRSFTFAHQVTTRRRTRNDNNGLSGHLRGAIALHSTASRPTGILRNVLSSSSDSLVGVLRCLFSISSRLWNV